MLANDIYFNSVASNGDSPPKSINSSSAKKKPEELKRPRILIVEDELLVAENIKEILQKGGYEVIAVISSGEEAIQEFTSLDPDLVMMDIRLAGSMDGI